MVTINEKNYYLEKLDSKYTNREIIFREDYVYLYKHSSYMNDPIYYNDTISLMRDVKQPTENVVRNAIIWSYGYEGEYKIKAGGESKSDTMFESSLVVTVACPKGGDDIDKVLIKKYSKVFENVLITLDEIKKLYAICKTDSERKIEREDRLQSCISLLYRGLKYNKIDTTRGTVTITSKHFESLYKILSEYSKKEVSTIIGKFTKNRSDEDVEYYNKILNLHQVVNTQ